MDHAVLQKEDENKKKGLIMSFVIHALLILIALIPYLVSDTDPTEISGIQVAFGTPDGGSSNANPISDTYETKVNDSNKESASEDNQNNSSSNTPDTETSEPKTNTAPQSKVEPVSNTSDVVVDERKKEQEEKAAAEAREAERMKRQAEERARIEAQKEADAKARQAAYDESKSKFSDLFGSGKGNNNNEGNQGDDKGDPNSDALNQLATGSGRIGGGLKDRGVLFEPEIKDRSQYTGTVVIKVCVNSKGKVVESKYTQMGSTTTNKVLVDLAIDGARKYQFTSSEVEMQCGNITIDFSVQ